MARNLSWSSQTRTALDPRHVVQHWREYLELTKPGVVALMAFTAVVGMLLASPKYLRS